MSAKTPKLTVPEAEAKAPTNGEYAAEQAAKAKAKAEAEQAKAEAEAKRVESIVRDEQLARLRPEVEAAGAGIEAAQTVLGNVLHKAEAFIPSRTFPTIESYAQEVIPEHCGPIWTSSPAYRSLQAARVVESVGADLVGSTSVDALTWLHRFTPEQRLQGFKKAKGRSTKPKVTKARLQEVFREMFPEQAEAKKGPKAGTEQASAGAKAKADKAKAEQAESSAVQEVLDALQAIRPEQAETEPTGPIVRDALADIGKCLQGHVDTFGGDAYGAGLQMLQATVDLCDKWTVPVVKAALRFRAEADKTKAEAEQAEAPKTRKTRKTTA